jgi:RHS repeat-associated protein
MVCHHQQEDRRYESRGWVVAYNLRLAGQVFDGQAGLHYNYFRDYDPATGRYVESDPIGLKGGVNTYAYVNDTRPLNRLALGREMTLESLQQNRDNDR